MNQIVDEAIDLYKQGSFFLAEEKCLSYVENCKQIFADQLTVNSATDFAAGVILFSQICSEEKKPWKAIPVLTNASGCFRFLEDFMQDREMFGNTAYSVATALQYAGLPGKASIYFEKAVMYSGDRQIVEESVYRLFLCCLQSGTAKPEEKMQLVEKYVTQDIAEEILKESESDFKNQIKTDPLEREEQYLENLYEIEKEVDSRMAESGDETPFCIRYWACKKKVLKEKFGIDWLSPADCNPNIRFQ